MPISEEIIKKVAEDTGIKMEELTKLGLLAILREKRRDIMIERLEVLKKYNVNSSKELREKIERGEIKEHPGWEEFILLENLEGTLEIVERDIEVIQESS